MSSAIKLIVYIIFILGILLGGLEIIRVAKFQMDFEDSVRLMLEDAMELTVDDTLRYSNITVIQKDELGVSGDTPQEIFYEILEKKYNLEKEEDKKFKAKSEDYFFKKVTFDSILLDRGSYEGDEYQHVQVEYPSIVVEGEIELKPLILLYKDNFKLPFKVEVGFEGHSDY